MKYFSFDNTSTVSSTNARFFWYCIIGKVFPVESKEEHKSKAHR